MSRKKLKENPSFFQKNREAFLKNMQEKSAALFFSSNESIRNNDQHHPWRQDSNFYYLTGIEERNCAVLLIPDNGASANEILFIPEFDQEIAKWEGVFLDNDKAISISGIKQIMPIEMLPRVLSKALQWKYHLYCDYNDQFSEQATTINHKKILELKSKHPGVQFIKASPLLSSLRASKKEYEIELIRTSLKLINKALHQAMKKIDTGVFEYEIEAELFYTYLKNGSKRTSFDPIVATGENATILHYIQHHSQLQQNDLLLIDTGAEWGMYSGDISRVYPVGKRFNERQNFCYQTVLNIQKKVISELKAGLTWEEIYQIASRIQGEELQNNGFIKDKKQHAKVTFHRIGHSLGLDVHDPYPIDQPLPARAVITIEPGLYLRDEKIGIRIEDNILLQENGYINLSVDIPKEIEEIEDIMNAFHNS